MKLINLVSHLKNSEQVRQLILKKLPDADPRCVEVYMENKIDINSNIIFVDSELVLCDMLINIDNIQYENFFPLSLAVEITGDILIESDQVTDTYVANRLLEYKLNDA